MDKTDKEKQRIIEKIAKKANEEATSLKDVQRDMMAAAYFNVVAQIKQSADTIGVSRDVLMLMFSNMIVNTLMSGTESDNTTEETKPTAKTHKPSKGGFIPPKGGFIQ